MQLPSRVALAKEYGVGLATLERAISALLSDGTLTASPGQRTVVSPQLSDPAEHEEHSTNWALRREKTLLPDSAKMVIGVVSYDADAVDGPTGNIENWPYRTLIALEQAVLRGEGIMLFTTLKSATGGAPRSIDDGVREVIEQGATTVVVLDIHGTIAPSEIRKLSSIQEREKVVMLHISDSDGDTKIPHVYYDGPHLGRQAIQHLVSKGHRTFAYVSPFRLQWSFDRYEQAKAQSVIEGLPENSVTPLFGDIEERPEGKAVAGSIQVKAAEKFGDTLFGADYPRCILAANDYIAYGLIDAGLKRGLRPGRDYAIVGFDDETRSLRYGLTTFRPPIDEIGKEAAVLLSRLLLGEDCEIQVRLRSRLIIRASTMNLVAAV